MTKPVNRLVLTIIIFVLCVLAVLNQGCKSSKHRGILAQNSVGIFYVANGQPNWQADATQIVVDTLEIDPNNVEQNIIQRDTFYRIHIIQAKTKDSAGKQVVWYSDSARKFPKLDTIYYLIDKYYIWDGRPKDFSKPAPKR